MRGSLLLLLAALLAVGHCQQRSTAEPISKIGYLKTHKTGSTTLGAVLYRYGARHRKRFFCGGAGPHPCEEHHILAPGWPVKPGEVYDFQLNHISGNGIDMSRSFGSVMAWYRRMLAPSTAVDGVPSWAFVTPIREPVMHYISWFMYYAEPDSHYRLEDWVASGSAANGLAAEFSMHTEEDVRRFLPYINWGGGGVTMSGSLQAWIPMERFDEALLLLRHHLGWDLVDMVYTKQYDSGVSGGYTRWDNKPIKPTPKLETLSSALVRRMLEINHLDVLLYNTTMAAFDAALAQLMGEPGSAERSAWEADVDTLSSYQAAMAATLKDKNEHCSWFRKWFMLNDRGYEWQIDNTGYSKPPPHETNTSRMLAVFNATGGQRFCTPPP